MSFPKLLTPEVYKDKATGKLNGEPKYSLRMILDPADTKKFKQEVDGKFADVDVVEVCKRLAALQWPNLTLPEIFPKLPNGMSAWPIQMGDKIMEVNAKKAKPSKMDYLAGKVQISATASEKVPPRLSYYDTVAGKRITLDRENPDDVKKIKKLFDGGNYAFCEVSIVPVEVSQKCYLTFYVNHVAFKKEGEKFGGQSLMDRFDGIDGGEGDFDPTNDNDFGV
jgi:hypothetical protein